MNSFFKNTAFLGLSLALISAGIAFFAKGGVWALAVVVGAAWIFLNVYFLFRLIAMGMNVQGGKKDKVLILSVFKFPVLYVAGFFILKSRFFPVYGIVIGLTAFMTALVITWGFSARTAFVEERVS